MKGFFRLLLYVIYIAHVFACLWVYLGRLDNCVGQTDCTKSWIFANSFNPDEIETLYVFSFYWIFEVLTTVGYGDYSGATKIEYLFSIIIQFVGLTVFSSLLGKINSTFNTADGFQDLIEEKLDSLDLWIKKIEKSNDPFHI